MMNDEPVIPSFNDGDFPDLGMSPGRRKYAARKNIHSAAIKHSTKKRGGMYNSNSGTTSCSYISFTHPVRLQGIESPVVQCPPASRLSAQVCYKYKYNIL